MTVAMLFAGPVARYAAVHVAVNLARHAAANLAAHGATPVAICIQYQEPRDGD